MQLRPITGFVIGPECMITPEDGGSAVVATEVELLGTVPYGQPLLELLRRYDAVVVPSLSDEQPRIVFDAFSQGVPILGSDTAGLRSCVENGETGLLTTPGDVDALAGVLRYALAHREELARLGMASLTVARSMTHQEMHRKRAVLLREMFQSI